MSARLVQMFSVKGDPARIAEQADLIMDALVELEKLDPTITDSSVSVEDGTRVIVELYTADRDRQDDMVGRVRSAVAMAGIRVHEMRRELEFAD